jgi:putative ABC transport system permease protein
LIVSIAVLVTGLWDALILGVIGGLLPGIRVARMPVTTGLREL